MHRKKGRTHILTESNKNAHQRIRRWDNRTTMFVTNMVVRCTDYTFLFLFTSTRFPRNECDAGQGGPVEEDVGAVTYPEADSFIDDSTCNLAENRGETRRRRNYHRRSSLLISRLSNWQNSNEESLQIHRL